MEDKDNGECRWGKLTRKKWKKFKQRIGTESVEIGAWKKGKARKLCKMMMELTVSLTRIYG